MEYLLKELKCIICMANNKYCQSCITKLNVLSPSQIKIKMI